MAAISRIGLMSVGAAMAASVLVATIAVLSRPDVAPPAKIVAARDLRFADLDGGVVGISDATTGAAIEQLPPGAGNFQRTLVRGLAQRRLHTTDSGQGAPFRLTAFEGGRLTLSDPETGRSIDLEAFGKTNEGAFARLLNLTPPER